MMEQYLASASPIADVSELQSPIYAHINMRASFQALGGSKNQLTSILNKNLTLASSKRAAREKADLLVT